jgi:hypothetical protein
MQAYLHRKYLQNVLCLIKVAFYKAFSPNLKRIIFKPYFYFCIIQVKLFVQFIKFYSKILFWFENFLFNVLKDCFEFYNFFCFGLNRFESILEKLQKKRKKERTKKCKRLRDRIWPRPGSGPRPTRGSFPKWYAAPRPSLHWHPGPTYHRPPPVRTPHPAQRSPQPSIASPRPKPYPLLQVLAAYKSPRDPLSLLSLFRSWDTARPRQ